MSTSSDMSYRWADDLEVGDWVFDRGFDHWGEVTGIRLKDRALCDKELPKEFLFTSRAGAPENEGLTFFIREFTYNDVLLTRTRRPL